MEKQLIKKINFLRSYTVLLTLAVAYLLYDSLRKAPEEITVERINIVEPNGDLKMVISNQARQHTGMMDGELLPQRERPPGMIFFNEEQDEVGGLIYQGNKIDGAIMALSLDQYKNDQVMQVRYQENGNGENSYGLRLWDRAATMPLTKKLRLIDSLRAAGVSNNNLSTQLTNLNRGVPTSADRFFVGKDFNKEVGIFIKDESGTDRIRLYVDIDNQPRFELLNERGEVIKDWSSESD